MKKFSFILKIIISITILIIVFSKIDYRASIAMISQISLPIVLLLIIISFIKLLTQTLNWKFCLSLVETQDKKFLQIFITHLIGLTLRLLVPGGYGSFGKVFYVNENKKHTVYAIITEKFFILWIICFFAVWAVVLAPVISNFEIIKPFWFIPIALLITIFPLFYHSFYKKSSIVDFKYKYFKMLPKIVSSQCVFIILTFLQYFIILKYFMSSEIAFIDVSLIISIILVSNIIPITYSGLGLREIASAWLLPMIGVPVEIAVGASLIIFLLNAIIPALPGFVLMVTEKTNK